MQKFLFFLTIKGGLGLTSEMKGMHGYPELLRWQRVI